MSQARLRFPKSARLSRSAEFARMRRQGESFHGRFMVLSVLRLGTDETARTGIVTSRRVGGAVQRNLVRRRLREIVRQAQHSLIRGVWLVMIARPAAAMAGLEALRADWTQLARRSLILAESCP